MNLGLRESLDPLEPLPVVDDDEVIVPLPSRGTRHERSRATIWTHMRAQATRLLLVPEYGDGSVGASSRPSSLKPGVAGELRGTSAARAANVWPAGRPTATNPTFTRMLDVTPERLARLPRWWSSAARRGRVRLTRRLTLDAPRPLPGGGWRMLGSLRRTIITPAARFELTLWPHLGRYTKLSLEPRRRVHAGRRWFRRGHRGLDRLAHALAAPP
jgi:hypothetical protein